LAAVRKCSAWRGESAAREALAQPPQRWPRPAVVAVVDRGPTWDECYDRYRKQRGSRVREKSLIDALSRIQLAGRILAAADEAGSDAGLFVRECFTLERLEYLQERLLAGDEGRFDARSPNTVNSTMGAVMAFVRFCHRHGWIDRVPPVEKLDADEVMKGRPITPAEFERMLAATTDVVGTAAAESWKFVLRILWETGFRLADVMDFAWDDDRHIHPVWPTGAGLFPILVIPSTQKNGEHQEVPMLPGLEALLHAIPQADRHGWVVNPRSFGRTECERMGKDRVSRTIAAIGKAADIVVRQADERRGHRVKYASAHDIRRGFAQRLVDAGVSVELLQLLMRHADFATTRRHYAGARAVQSASLDLRQRLAAATSPAIAGGLMGGGEPAPRLTEVESAKLKALLASL
jgi:integrase